MKDLFSRMHPLVNFVFFSAEIAISMFVSNPVFLLISFISALLNAGFMNGKKAAALSLKFILPSAVLVSLINPLFNHRGATIIKYLPWNNPLTLESVLYGISSAILLGTVILWFSCVNTVMTSDKFIYLFGRIMPSFSLLISMSLRFVPRFTARYREIKKSRMSMGAQHSKGVFSRIKNAVNAISLLISWSMEGSIETADSMKSRGYGLRGRTAYSIYKFGKTDIVWIGVISAEIALILSGVFSGAVASRYYPTIKLAPFNAFSVCVYASFLMLSLTPLIINFRERMLLNANGSN